MFTLPPALPLLGLSLSCTMPRHVFVSHHLLIDVIERHGSEMPLHPPTHLPVTCLPDLYALPLPMQPHCAHLLTMSSSVIAANCPSTSGSSVGGGSVAPASLASPLDPPASSMAVEGADHSYTVWRVRSRNAF